MYERLFKGSSCLLFLHIVLPVFLCLSRVHRYILRLRGLQNLVRACESLVSHCGLSVFPSALSLRSTNSATGCPDSFASFIANMGAIFRESMGLPPQAKLPQTGTFLRTLKYSLPSSPWRRWTPSI
jgi:hypothetical protein